MGDLVASDGVELAARVPIPRIGRPESCDCARDVGVGARRRGRVVSADDDRLDGLGGDQDGNDQCERRRGVRTLGDRVEPGRDGGQLDQCFDRLVNADRCSESSRHRLVTLARSVVRLVGLRVIAVGRPSGREKAIRRSRAATPDVSDVPVVLASAPKDGRRPVIPVGGVGRMETGTVSGRPEDRRMPSHTSGSSEQSFDRGMLVKRNRDMRAQ